jgi:hypothetical protein
MQVILLSMLAAAPDVSVINDLIKKVPGTTSPPTQISHTSYDGARVSQRSVVSSRPVAELRAHFEAEFKRAGLYVAPETRDLRMEKGEQVTGLDTENLIAYSAILQPSGKLTTVVVAAAEIGMGKTQSVAPIAPVFPGATDVTAMGLEGVKMMTYTAPGTPAEIKAFYRETLAKAGWQQQGEETIFHKGGSQLTVMVTPGISERYVMVELQDGAFKP